MPPTRRPPSSGRLPIGPPGTELYSLGDSVMANGGRFGYALSVATDESRTVNWVIRTRLSRVNSSGDVGRRVAARTQMLTAKTLHSPTAIPFIFEIQPQPAFYLYEFLIETSSGKRLAQYGQYLRVVPSVTRARLVTNLGSYRQGERAYFRVENMGTTTIGLKSEAFVLERFTGASWVEDPASPKVFARVRLGSLPPGAIGFCRNFELPATLEPGTYRFRKDVAAAPSGNVRRLTARFVIGA